MNSKRRSGASLPKTRKILYTLAALLLVFAAIYTTFSYSDISFIRTLRHMAIETSLSTMRHQWVAYAIFPDAVVDEVRDSVAAARKTQIGVHTTWETPADEIVDPTSAPRQQFFDTFWELDEISMQQYLIKHPIVLHNGWENIRINSSGLSDKGTEIKTIHGDTVLAIDAKNGVLLIRVADGAYRGVLAIAKDAARVSLRPSADIGYDGQLVGEIAQANNGILALTGSGFQDIDIHGNVGQGNGGIVAGLARCSGTTYGVPMGTGFKRAELRTDGLLYVVDSTEPVSDDCTDAVEFAPALIVDGEVLVGDSAGWNSINPRACIGQNDRGEIMMLCVEGRQLSSLGISYTGCAEILQRYSCMQALNLDGGTSAILWYDGQCVTRCSNEDYPEGRPLPTVFVYEKSSE